MPNFAKYAKEEKVHHLGVQLSCDHYDHWPWLHPAIQLSKPAKLLTPKSWKASGCWVPKGVCMGLPPKKSRSIQIRLPGIRFEALASYLAKFPMTCRQKKTAKITGSNHHRHRKHKIQVSKKSISWTQIPSIQKNHQFNIRKKDRRHDCLLATTGNRSQTQRELNV